MSTTKRIVDRDGGRKADLAAIHMGKKALGWDDEFYRQVMRARCGVSSAAQLDFAGRKALLAHMAACGWQDVRRALSPAAAARDRKPLTPSQKKIWSLWQQLADAGLVNDRRMPALLAFVKRQTGVDALDWLNGKQEELVIESLKAMLNERAGGAW